MYTQMFKSVQLDLIKKATRIDSKKKRGSRNPHDFGYVYGYTEDGDIALMNSFAIYLVLPDELYINPQAVFQGDAVGTPTVMHFLDDKNTFDAEMTADLKQMENGTTVHVFEVDNGEQVLIDTKLFKPFKDLKIELKFKASSPINPVFVYNELGRQIRCTIRDSGLRRSARH